MEFDTVVAVENVIAASNTTQTLAPIPVRSSVQELPVLQQVQEVPLWDPPSSQSAKPEVDKTESESKSELDKIEAAALNVVHAIEDKMEIVTRTVEGVFVEPVRKAIHVHVPAGGGSIIKNPG